jgi:hypothetical protein
MAQVITELVGHRLALGFQMVVVKNNNNAANTNSNSTSSSSSTTSTQTTTTPSSNTNNPSANININSKLDTNTNTTTQLSTTPTNMNTTTATTQLNNFISLNSFSMINNILSKSHLRIPYSWIKGYYVLCLGRIYHELFYIVDESTKTDYVEVLIYKPKEKKDKLGLQSSETNALGPGLSASKDSEYKYRFQVPDSKTYDLSTSNMHQKNVESIRWNDIDRYICIQGNGTLKTSELQKVWRQRLYLLPVVYVQAPIRQQQQQQLKTTIENNTIINPPTPLNSYNSQTILTLQNLTPSQIPASMMQNTVKPSRCDIYERKSYDELRFFRDYYFIKFVELLNKLTRADEKRAYSKSSLAYMEANSVIPHANECLSPYAIMSNSSLTQIQHQQNNHSNINTSR